MYSSNNAGTYMLHEEGIKLVYMPFPMHTHIPIHMHTTR